MREIRSSGSVEGVMSNRDPYSDFPEPFWLVGATKVYSGLGADIVMESFTLKFFYSMYFCRSPLAASRG
jgi:hypothetical protein